MSFRRIAGGLILVAILTIVGYWAYLQFLAPLPEQANSAATELGQLDNDVDDAVISAEGAVVPLHQAHLSTQTAGQVVEIAFRQGESVQRGDPLIRLRASELESGLAQAQAGLAQAQANLAMAGAGVLAAQERVASANAGVTAAQAQLALLLAVPLPAEVAAAESNVGIAAAGIAQAEASRDVALEIPQALVRAAEAQVAAALADQRVLQDQHDALIRNGIGGTPEEQARYALNAAVANLSASQAALDELNAGPTSARRRAAEASVSVARAQHIAAQSQLDLLFAGAKEEQVAVLQAGLEQAQAMVAQSVVAVTQAEASVAQAEAGLLQAEAAVELARTALEKTVLTAPFDGIVAELSAEIGENVVPGLHVITVASTGEWLVETTDLTELDVVELASGLTARVRVDAFPEESLSGTITGISPASGLTRGDVTYVVTIRLEDAAELPLRWGMTAFIDIELKQ
jgi:multidrug resistance efflux pump